MAYDFNQLSQFGTLLSNFNPSYKREIITVNGYKEAQDFKLVRGERVVLLDTNEDVVFIKSCDDFGKYILKVYSCKDITEQYQKKNEPASISISQFNELTDKINKITELLGDKHELNASEQPELNFSGDTVRKQSEKK